MTTTTKTQCESATKTTTIECSDAPEMFRTVKRWAGRKSTVTECLSHAIASENRGQQVTVIRH